MKSEDKCIFCASEKVSYYEAKEEHGGPVRGCLECGEALFKEVHQLAICDGCAKENNLNVRISEYLAARRSKARKITLQ